MQSNHRSWADFYLDVVATDGNAQMLSRMAVALVFPMFMGAVCVIRSVILFQRGRKHDKEVRPDACTALMQHFARWRNLGGRNLPAYDLGIRLRRASTVLTAFP